jgi:hypothetical protein
LDTTNSYFTFDLTLSINDGTVAVNTVTATEPTFSSATNTESWKSGPVTTADDSAVVPVGGITSLIRMVRLISRGAIIEVSEIFFSFCL